MKKLGSYKNGNYIVTVFDDGTKVRYNELDYFTPEKPESIDLKITNCCNGVNGMLCPQCHEKSNPNGKHGDIMNLKFINTMLPHTEVAIGGGDPLTHPDFAPFLAKLKKHNLIANMTVNQWSFMQNLDKIDWLIENELIHGLGVSLNDPTKEFIEDIKKYPNAVIHVINGIVDMLQLKKLSGHHLKLLILGFKTYGRGEPYYKALSGQVEALKSDFYNSISTIINEKWFDCVSFDNLAIEQLNPKRLMSDDEWQKFYLGNDGFASMYIDAVNEEFAKSSVSTERYPVEDDIKTMFDKVRSV